MVSMIFFKQDDGNKTAYQRFMTEVYYRSAYHKELKPEA